VQGLEIVPSVDGTAGAGRGYVARTAVKSDTFMGLLLLLWYWFYAGRQLWCWKNHSWIV